VPWLAVDVALAVLSLGLLAAVLLSLWRAVKALSRTASEAGETVAAASERLADAQAERPRSR
jgi:hypothetical protein